MKELIDIFSAWERRRGEPLALATLVRTQGSSYRRAGARMLISADGTTVGSLSGGCLEEEVVARAREVMRTGLPALMEFDTRRRFGCHGKIEILIEVAPAALLDGLRETFAKRRACRVATVFAEGEIERGSRFLAADESIADTAFVQQIAPPIQLILFGAGPDSVPLRAFAELLGWSVLEIEEAASLPAQADQRTAAIVKSHNYGRDFAALRHLLQLDLPYRRIARSAAATRSIARRFTRQRRVDCRGTLLARRSRSGCGNAGGNRSRAHRRNPSGFRGGEW